MKQFIAILVFATGISINCHAQSFLGDLQKQKQGEGTVTVKQSADIDNLVNNAKLKSSQQAAQQQKNSQQQTQKPAADNHHGDSTEHKTTPSHQDDNAAHKQNATNEHGTNTPTDRSQAIKSADSDVIDTSKKMMRNSRKITGYRIQAYSGGNSRADREKANRIGDAIKMRFPDQPVYVHFYSPRWICRVGNFRSYNEAASVLKSIKAMGYPQACIVKGKISVGY